MCWAAVRENNCCQNNSSAREWSHPFDLQPKMLKRKIPFLFSFFFLILAERKVLCFSNPENGEWRITSPALSVLRNARADWAAFSRAPRPAPGCVPQTDHG